MTIKKFSKAFRPCAILSCVIIVSGIIAFFTRGINFGIDFVPGLVEEVRIAPEAIELSYSGIDSVEVKLSSTKLDLVISGTGSDNETKSYTFGMYPTVEVLVNALNEVDGITAVLKGSANADTYSLYVNSAVSARLSSDSDYRLYVPEEKSSVTADELRDVLSEYNVSIKELGEDSSRAFQIRVAAQKEEVVSNETAAEVASAETTEENAENAADEAAPAVAAKSSDNELLTAITAKLSDKYGADKVAVIKTDFVSSSFSSTLAGKSILLAIVTIFLIWVYATIRFHWDFALGSIIALLHDCLIMVAFICWSQIEFSVTTLAAILTIFGYSINATVVILDRIRENIRFVQTKDFNDIINKSVSGTLGRSIITTVTTLFASTALIVFTTGSIHDFAIVLTVGLISGCYSSMFISSGFISFVRRNWKPEYKGHVHQPKAKKEVTIQLDD